MKEVVVSIYFVTSCRKRFDYFESEIEVIEEIICGDIDLEEETGKMENVFKSNLIEISKGRYKSEEHRISVKNIKLIYNAQDAAIKLLMIIL